MPWPQWTKEPLLHFALLGAIVIGVHGRLARPVAGASDEDLLYAEARALGLDEDDPIVRRRLIQKMELLLDRKAALETPRPEALAAYVEAHRAELSTPPTLDLEHVFFRAAQPGLQAARAALEAGADPGALGEPFIHGRRFEALTSARATALFGAPFAEALEALPLGRWGELSSAYGLHLVRVRARRPAELLPPAAREALAREGLLRARREAARAELLDRLRSKYAAR